jgi:ABC-2 type transport system permease protein
MCSSRLLESALRSYAPLRPLLVKELWGVIGGRALWTMLLILCPLVGYSFLQAVALYSEASSAVPQSSALASGLSPLDGVLVPSWGAFYIGVTLLFPFVAIRVLGLEKESGALRVLVQMPYRLPTLVAAKLGAILAAWLLASLPALSTLAVWSVLGGHLYMPETLNLLFGHLLYGLLVGAIALFATAISEGAATAAIITLAFTIGSWVLDFTIAGRPGLFAWLSRFSLTQTLRSFEQGLLQASVVLGILTAICGFAALTAVWLPPGIGVRRKLAYSSACIAAAAIIFPLTAQLAPSIDVTEDGRNSFPAADVHSLADLTRPLLITIHLAPEDPRYIDLQRNVLAKLARVLPSITIHLATGRESILGGESDPSYGEIEYAYDGQSAKSRSTSEQEILPLLYALAGTPVPVPSPADNYPGYPLMAHAESACVWFYGLAPMLIVTAWWWSRRPPIGSASNRMEINHDVCTTFVGRKNGRRNLESGSCSAVGERTKGD